MAEGEEAKVRIIAGLAVALFGMGCLMVLAAFEQPEPVAISINAGDR